jgi:hypothetical protein
MPAAQQYDPTNPTPYQAPVLPDPQPAMPSPLPTQMPEVNGAVKHSGAVATVADGILRGFMQGRAYSQAKQVMQLKKKTDDLQNSYNQDAVRLYQLTQAGVPEDSAEYKAAKSSVDGSWGALMDFYGQHIEQMTGDKKGKKKKTDQQLPPQAVLTNPTSTPFEKAQAWYQVSKQAGPPVYGQISMLNTPEAKAKRQAATINAQTGVTAAQADATGAKAEGVKNENELTVEEAIKERDALLLKMQNQPASAQVEEKPEDAFKRNKPYVKPGAAPFITTLPPDKEKQFQDWAAKNPDLVKGELDTKTPDYDVRGRWLADQNGDPDAKLTRSAFDGKLHASDRWKTPFHRTFSAESIYANPDAPKWDGNVLKDKDGNVIADETPGKRTQGEPDWDASDYREHGLPVPADVLRIEALNKVLAAHGKAGDEVKIERDNIARRIQEDPNYVPTAAQLVVLGRNVPAAKTAKATWKGNSLVDVVDSTGKAYTPEELEKGEGSEEAQELYKSALKVQDDERKASKEKADQWYSHANYSDTLQTKRAIRALGLKASAADIKEWSQKEDAANTAEEVYQEAAAVKVPTTTSDQKLLIQWVRSNNPRSSRLPDSEIKRGLAAGDYTTRAQNAWDQAAHGTLAPELHKDFLADIRNAAQSNREEADKLKEDYGLDDDTLKAIAGAQGGGPGKSGGKPSSSDSGGFDWNAHPVVKP